ncbi:DUF1289 domain-containing protein [Oleiphilus messinensis]|uniref:DUF1289 domain-containing protein n=1 Tax=Oleiphilus messinensis TaxID=141451 RepID=UPI000B3B223F|nr:DUF1289 domain-containing protein [Oleiphilus messinensis]
MTIESPCIRRCTLDQDDVCIGCLRSLEEIKNWNKMSEAEKQLLIEDLKQRQKKSPYFRKHFF